jgi:hypothetical protein
VWGCCSANGAIGLYYAWHGITRFDVSSRTATVNLLLNRAADWLDIDSYLPYQGKVVLHNKKARAALVRVPYWVPPADIKCFLNDKAVTPFMAGRYLVFEDLRPSGGLGAGGEAIRIEFPVPTAVERHTIGSRQYTLTFRGSTLVDITPREDNPAKLQYYLRESLKANQAPMRQVKRFVADRVLPLQ